MEYSQTCPCTAQALSAAKDAARYDREIHDITLEIAHLERDKLMVLERAKRAKMRAFASDVGGCITCGGTQKITGNRSADTGLGRKVVMTLTQSERIG